MELSIDTIVAVAGLFIGGGGGAFFTWRYQRKKAKAEAVGAEANAAKELQEVYQSLVSDIKTDRDEQKQYIAELKDDRRHLRQERDELRKRQDDLEETVRTLKIDVARNGRQLECMRPFLCGDTDCKNRRPVAASDIGESRTRTTKKSKADGTQA